jgi:hypothetical protein
MPCATALAAVPGLPATSRRESDDDYFAVVAVLNDRWRVIRCRDGLQWIIQYRSSASGTYAGARWASRSHLRTREALIRVCAALTGPIGPATLATLHSLPPRI